MMCAMLRACTVCHWLIGTMTRANAIPIVIRFLTPKWNARKSWVSSSAPSPAPPPPFNSQSPHRRHRMNKQTMITNKFNANDIFFSRFFSSFVVFCRFSINSQNRLLSKWFCQRSAWNATFYSPAKTYWVRYEFSCCHLFASQKTQLGKNLR